MISPERGNFFGENYMGDADSPDKLEQPKGIGEAVKPSHDEGIATQALQIPTPEIGGVKFNLDYALPYVVTEVSREFSPFYLDEESIGLEDKLIGRVGEDDVIKSKETAAENIAGFFAERGVKIIRAMETLHGENYAARARALMRSGGMAPNSSPQGQEDMRIVGHLEQSLSAFVRELNSNITPDANKFRQEIYEKLRTKDPKEVLSLYRRGLISAKPDSDFGYPKKSTSEVLGNMKPSRRSAWGFMRNLVKTLSSPEFRARSTSLSQSTV